MEGGSGGTSSEKFEVLHALSVFWGLLKLLFSACIQYIPASCRLGFRSKSMTYGVLASGLRTSYKMCIGSLRLSSISAKQADLKDLGFVSLLC